MRRQAQASLTSYTAVCVRIRQEVPRVGTEEVGTEVQLASLN